MFFILKYLIKIFFYKKIVPVSARFGYVKVGGYYEMIINVKNEDIIAQRINIKQPETKYIKVFTKNKGLISMGFTR